MRAVTRLAVCDPYAAGEDLTIADFYTFYCFSLAGMLAKNVVGVGLSAQRDRARQPREPDRDGGGEDRSDRSRRLPLAQKRCRLHKLNRGESFDSPRLNIYVRRFNATRLCD
jgi:glutathione S-transferase